VILVILESVPKFNQKYGHIFKILEWGITIIFSVEYFIRIIISRFPKKYVLSFFGIIDLLSVLPTFISITLAGAQGLMVIRAIRLLRVFRILKLTRYTSEGRIILEALRASRIKISVFLFAILMLIIVIGTLMYLVEGEEGGYTSIPVSIYWAIVTLTTVGYGDITPLTDLGKFISALVMLMGYAIIAVPTGIVTTELAQSYRRNRNKQICLSCRNEDHDPDARYCKKCGEKL
ncbi:MAG: ion transporter, partial [Bacteroidales bacterium]|nr:ion transporter [Bacteroidales bacterium]